MYHDKLKQAKRIEPVRFDTSLSPDYSKAGSVAPIMRAAFLRHRTNGLNVQFMNEGELDEWSFATVAQRDAFTAKLAKQSRAFVLSV